MSNEAENTLPEQTALLGTNEEQDQTATLQPTGASQEENFEQSTPPDGAEGEGGEQGKSAEKHKPSGIERRFKKFQQRLDEQARELEYWRQAALQTGATQPNQQPQQVDARSIADFGSVDEYVEYRLQQKEQEILQKAVGLTQQQQQEQQILQSYNQRVSAAKTELPDWDEVMIDAAEIPVTPEVVQFCMDSAVGPKIAYHFAKNPDDLDNLNALPMHRRLAELGKLEAQLMGSVSTAVQPRTSKAPPKLNGPSATAAAPRTVVDAEPKSWAEWQERKKFLKVARF